MKIPKTNTTGTLRRALLLLGASGALATGLALLAFTAPHARASTLTASDGATGDQFGWSVSLSENRALAGARGDDDNGTESGSAYYFRGIPGNSVVTMAQNVKLLASDGFTADYFGTSVSLSGDRALVSAIYDDDKGPDSGSIYYYKGLDSAISAGTQVVNEDVKLLASDGAPSDRFGQSVSLSGDSALAGAYQRGSSTGAAYYYKALDGKSGKVNENVKLLASDVVPNDNFGRSVSLSGDSALAGADGNDGNAPDSGSAYYFKGLDSAVSAGTTVVTQDVKLLASDGAPNDSFGWSVSLSGDRALAGAQGDDDRGSASGSAYYFKGLSGKSGTVNQDVKLLASDGAASDNFGLSVSLSADNALVGAVLGDGNVADTGAAYYFKGLSGKSGTVNQDVKLLASDGAASDNFGYSVSMEGDIFVIGARNAQVNGVATGKAYAGDIRAFTTLDTGAGEMWTGGLSFVSQGDWVIGENTSSNHVMLGRNAATGIADTANVTAAGAAVYIGKNAGSAYNWLDIEGELTANAVYLGAAGNSANGVVLRTPGRVTADEVTIAAGSIVGSILGAAGDNGRVDAGEIVFGGTLMLVPGDGFAAVAGAEWKLFDFTARTGTFATIDTSSAPLGAGLEWNFDRLYTEGIVAIVQTPVPPVIGSFTVDNPPVPTATISASPASGTAPLASTVTWSTGNAASVTVSGPGLDSDESTGSQLISSLPAGSHTWTVTATTSTRARLSWSVQPDDGTLTLTLLTPSGSVDVTGQTGHYVTEPGSYTLQVTNAAGTISSGPVTVVLPGPASDSVTITVAAPASIDSFTPPTVKQPSVVMFNATPNTGTAPLDTTINWATVEASSVTVSGPGLSSTGPSGSQAVTGLAAGTHTWTVTAQPQTSGTLTWTTSNAATLTLVTPSGSVNVTGQTSYIATQSGSYTLQATNTLGATVSETRTVTLPTSAASATVTVTVTAPASIGSFTVSNPPVPTATISASPVSGTAPLDSTLVWNAIDAGMVTVTGPGLNTNVAQGSHSLTGLAAGSHIYVVAAQPKPTSTFYWSVTGASTLQLVTPSGSVNVTGQTSYIATEPGAYTLLAFNALGAMVASSPVTVVRPATAVASVTITVDEAVAEAAPATLDEPVINGSTITINVLGTPGNYYALHASEELKAPAALWGFVSGTAGQFDDYGVATLTFPKSAATAEFYRVVTSATSLASGAINADAKFSYNVGGRYAVTIPANGLKLVAHQLVSSKTTVQQLFAALPNRSSVTVQNIETGDMYPASSKGITGSWSGGDREVPAGYAVAARNGNASASVTLDFAGIVPEAARSYTIVAGMELLMGVQYPEAVNTPEAVGYVRARSDNFSKQNGAEDAYTAYGLTIAGNWPAGGAPAFDIGEGFIFRGNTSKTWVQPALTLDEDSIEIE
ncbi:hypothetical protein [Geminisphaera colitermitum]|uniref:hypothetical protein n=1 Tax=Geminisphaera colitermitum TaxID=1148786 RepID=UPI000158CB2A|nr:hypothetical protein [Geminisphaera colitermitum]